MKIKNINIHPDTYTQKTLTNTNKQNKKTHITYASCNHCCQTQLQTCRPNSISFGRSRNWLGDDDDDGGGGGDGDEAGGGGGGGSVLWLSEFQTLERILQLSKNFSYL